MSTAVDTAFEELTSAYDETAEPMHGVCGFCYPGDIVPAGAVAICGHRFETAEPVTYCSGEHKCARCIALDMSPLSCGHP